MTTNFVNFYQLKVLAIADIHLTGEGYNTPQYIALNNALEVIEKDIDLVVVVGDVYDSVSTVQQRSAFKEWVVKCLNKCDVVVLRGNHDQRGDLGSFLSNTKGAMGNCYVIDDRPNKIYLENLDLDIYGLPHIGIGQLMGYGNNNGEDLNKVGNHYLDSVIKGWALEIKESKHKSLCLFHGVVSGAKLDNGYIPRDNGIHLTKKQIESLRCPVACGHYHQYQKVAKNAFYSGSPARKNFGESDGDKGCLVYEYKDNEWLEPVFHSLNPQKMLLAECVWKDGHWEYDRHYKQDEIKNAVIRVRFKINIDQVSEASASIKLIEDKFKSADSIKLERIIESVVASRCSDIAITQTIKESLVIWLQQSNRDPNDFIHLLDMVLET